MKILVLNAGSSSLKYSLFEMQASSALISGLVERIGEAGSIHRYKLLNAVQQQTEMTIRNHQQALHELFALLTRLDILSAEKSLYCIGHRVVHGGELFRQPVIINAEVLEQITAISPLAPLHNPANLQGIQVAMQLMPHIPQVAVFDTAYHQSLPDYAYRYALPIEFYSENGVRRYGFHGTSHRYVAGKAAEMLSKPLLECNLITLHLGNGASVTAIENGLSIDTSMGMTPLEGLMMGSRCGDMDTAIVFYLGRNLNLSNAEIENILNKNSGCKGICGENDMRSIHQLAEKGDQNASLALEMYSYRIKKYIGAYFAVLNRVDAIVFTGGIGENDSWLRARCCDQLTALGIEIDVQKNQNPPRPCAIISSVSAKTPVFVIATDEELEIATQAKNTLDS